MTKDYRRPSTATRRRSATRGTCAFWFLLGGVLGAFGVGYAWMIYEPAAQGVISKEANTRPAPNPPQERTFDFYSLLPEEEVVVPADDEAPVAPALPTPANTATAPQTANKPAQKPTDKPAGSANKTAAATPSPPASATAAPSAGSGAYLLQLGSFRGNADAERLRAQLALKGIQTSIQTVTIENGQTYHRVRTATYDKSEAQALRNQLQSQGQESMMIRAR